jgi:hypothetical protein
MRTCEITGVLDDPERDSGLSCGHLEESNKKKKKKKKPIFHGLMEMAEAGSV